MQPFFTSVDDPQILENRIALFNILHLNKETCDELKTGQNYEDFKYFSNFFFLRLNYD